MHALKVLVTCLAYVAEADGEITPGERAVMLADLEKWVGPGLLNQDQLKELVQHGFAEAKSKPVESFLKTVGGTLSKAQGLSILLNIIDIALVDGDLKEGERQIIERVTHALDVSSADYKACLAVLGLKESIGVYLDPTHIWNESDYQLPVALRE